jgi:PAS domain S-box-containing protein
MGHVASVIDPSAFMIVNDKLSHGCDLLISNPSARQVFAQYIKRGDWIPFISQQMKADRALKELHLELNNTDPDITYSVGPNDFVMPPTGQHYVETFLSNDAQRVDLNSTESKVTAAAEIIETCFSSIQMKSVLLASLFPLFLNSPDYALWVEEKGKNKSPDGSEFLIKSTATTSAKLLNATVEDSAVGRDQRLDELFQAQDKRIQDILTQAVTSIDESELEKFLSSGTWISQLLASVEDLPLCVSIATASLDRKGFPLVYVNKAFEKTTMYPRKEIVGQNCKFLQSEKSEKEQISLLTEALRNAQPCKVALTNTRKDGTEFFNLLSMKPIFNSEGVYSYVIGVQFDISNPESSVKQIQLIDDLLSILPNIFK